MILEKCSQNRNGIVSDIYTFVFSLFPTEAKLRVDFQDFLNYNVLVDVLRFYGHSRSEPHQAVA